MQNIICLLESDIRFLFGMTRDPKDLADLHLRMHLCDCVTMGMYLSRFIMISFLMCRLCQGVMGTARTIIRSPTGATRRPLGQSSWADAGYCSR